MSIDEAYAIWDDLDAHRYGYISPSSLQRWLSDFSEFNIPFEDLHYLYNCFQVRETDGRITEEQFVKILVGPNASLSGENDKEGGDGEPVDDKPVKGKWHFCSKEKKWVKH
jgi:hypothetical protein